MLIVKLEVSLFTVLLFKHGNGFQNTEWVLDTDYKTVVEINISKTFLIHWNVTLCSGVCLNRWAMKKKVLRICRGGLCIYLRYGGIYTQYSDYVVCIGKTFSPQKVREWGNCLYHFTRHQKNFFRHKKGTDGFIFLLKFLTSVIFFIVL